MFIALLLVSPVALSQALATTPIEVPDPCDTVSCHDPAPDLCERLPCEDPAPNPCERVRCDVDPEDPCARVHCPPPPDPCALVSPCPPPPPPPPPPPDPCVTPPCNPDPCTPNTCPDPCGEGGPDCPEPCGCPSEHYVLELNTGTFGGTKQAYGAVDPDWHTTSSPYGAGSAWSIPPHPGWALDTPIANWINADPSAPGKNRPVPVGTYVYEIDFWLPAGVTAILNMRYSVDDEVDFYLQSTSTPSIGGVHTASAWTSYHFLTWSGPLPSGPNRLIAVTTNVGANVHGLFVEATLDVYVKRTCTLTIDLTTGSVGSGPALASWGAIDDDWYVVTFPNQTTLGPFNAYVVVPAAVWATSPSAKWISPFGYATGANPSSAPAGKYVYAIDFKLPCAPRCDNITLDLDYAADDRVTFELNGLPIAAKPAPAFTSVTSFTYKDCRGFLVGMNHLYAYVDNLSHWTGLLVHGTLTVTY